MEKNEEIFVSTMMPVLDEKARRLFLGAYSECLGRGSISDLNKLTGISRTTMTEGCKEIKSITPNPKARGEETDNRGTRAKGTGRKTTIEQYPKIKEELYKLLDGNTVGNPENPLCWTTKSLRNLTDALQEMGYKISHPTVGVLLEEMGFSLQQNRKYMESGDAGPDRDEQFKYINDQSKEFLAAGLPVISVDTKKERIDRTLQKWRCRVPT